jgi:hypothetical protein
MGFSNLITKAVGTVAKDIVNQSNPSVCELGNQTLKNKKARAEIYKDLGITPAENLTGTKDWYFSIGFKRYLAIDVNTERDAIAMDLNTDIGKQYNFYDQFDLVTDNGTGEHVFNQYTLFKNAHDLCKVGGYMIHVLPFYRWVDHGFYNYNPNLFPCLANQNEYNLTDLWIATSDASKLEKLNVKNLSRYKGYRYDFDLDSWESDPMVVAVMCKTKNKAFEMPIQTLYGSDNINSDEISGRYR